MSQKTVVSIQPDDRAVVATILLDRLGQDDSARMQAEVLAAAERAVDKPVILDMTNVEFMASMALGALVDLTRTLRKAGRGFTLVCVNPTARHTLTITRLDKLFDIRETLEDAFE